MGQAELGHLPPLSLGKQNPRTLGSGYSACNPFVLGVEKPDAGDIENKSHLKSHSKPHQALGVGLTFSVSTDMSIL